MKHFKDNADSIPSFSKKEHHHLFLRQCHVAKGVAILRWMFDIHNFIFCAGFVQTGVYSEE